MKFCCVMKMKRYSQFSMKGEEPFTSESPPAQPPGSPTTSPPHPPVSLFPHCFSSQGAFQTLLYPLEAGLQSPCDRGRKVWWRVVGRTLTWPWCRGSWVSLGAAGGESVAPGPWDAVKLLSATRDLWRSCAGVLGVRHWKGRFGNFWVLPCHGASLPACRGKKGVRNM